VGAPWGVNAKEFKGYVNYKGNLSEYGDQLIDMEQELGDLDLDSIPFYFKPP
jgi:hypothetical protein